METIPTARSKEDIALDLMKFVAAQAHIPSKPAGVTGFGAASAAKTDDPVLQLLELYARCRHAVEAPAPTK